MKLRKIISRINTSGVYTAIALVGIAFFTEMPTARSQGEEAVSPKDSVAPIPAAETPEVVEEVVERTSEDATGEEIESGKALFAGAKRFDGGGASCLTCHNVNNEALLGGGRLAKDLTNVYDRLGSAGITGMLSSPPFPAMAEAYAGKDLTEQEIFELTAFLAKATVMGDGEKSGKGNAYFYVGGTVGFIVLMVIISLLWFDRKKQSVKRGIFDRQIRATSSVKY